MEKHRQTNLSDFDFKDGCGKIYFSEKGYGYVCIKDWLCEKCDSIK